MGLGSLGLKIDQLLLGGTRRVRDFLRECVKFFLRKACKGFFLRECVREYWEYELHLPPLPRERLSVRLCVEEIWPKIYWTSLRY